VIRDAEVGVGQLPKPSVPDGPRRGLVDALHELHHRAGWPSLREMAKEAGCSHTTVSAVFSSPVLPRWGLLELIVEMLGGDTERFRDLWLAASSPGPVVPRAATVPDPREPSPPRQLPGDVTAFTGRADQIADLDRLLDETMATTAVVIAALTGTAGVGKTTLAVHWAHRVRGAFPDGQLYLNLRGYAPDRPAEPAEALETLLCSLGMDRLAVPHGIAERAARYRTLIADRKMLVLLDNVLSVDQVRDLLPGTPSCFVLVTSRDRLPALVARHGAARINLEVLSTRESVQLLRRLLGSRVDAEPDGCVALAQRCARLPLGLRIAAELAAARPSVPLARLAAELGDESRRLDLLAAGEDDYTAVRGVFSWSCRHLPPDALAAFQLLGVHPGEDIDVAATAALLGLDPAATQRALTQLVRAHLVTETASGRHGMHDLLRAYAAEQAAGRDDAATARRRLFDHYLATATRVVEAADPGDTWLADERANLIAVATEAVETSPQHTLGLSACLARHLDVSANYRDAIALHGLAVRAGGGVAALNRLGAAHMRIGSYLSAIEHHEHALTLSGELRDAAGEGDARHGLGTVAWRQGRHLEARRHFEAVLAIRRKLGDRPGEGAALYGLGTVHRQLGGYRDALDHQRRALAIYRECGDLVGQCRVLNNLGTTLERMGRYQEAFDHYERALALNRRIGNRVGEAVALTNLGFAGTRLGRFTEAAEHHRQAFPLYVETGYRAGEADALHGLGDVHRRTGRLDEAARHLRAAIALAHEIGEADVEAGALIDLGETLRATGDPAEAADAYRQALDLTRHTGDRYEQARALSGLAHLDLAVGDRALARERGNAALLLFEALAVPEAADVRRFLDRAGPA
jgi:tetratricopeptide (TPR) repeat protein